MSLKHINTAAIAEARQGITGDCQADQIIRSVEYSAVRYLADDNRDSAKIARLQWQIGTLQGELRRVCRNYAEVVEPLISEDDDGEVGVAANDMTASA